MYQAIQDGILIGLLLNFSFGPIFFLLIELSIKRGYAAALALDIGVFSSDIMYMLVAYFGADYFKKYFNTNYIGIIGGALIISFGITKFLGNEKEKKAVEVDKNTLEESYTTLALKGFFINTFNPNVFIIWFAQANLSFNKYQGDTNKVFSYLIAILLGFAVIDLVKIYSAYKIRDYLNDTIMQKINKVVGIILIGIGVYLALSSFNELHTNL